MLARCTEVLRVRSCTQRRVLAVTSNRNTITANVVNTAVSDGHSINTFIAYDNVSLETARILAGDISDMYLDGITSMSPEIVSTLAGHVGMLLSLDGLGSISSDVSDALSSHGGLRLLNGLESLDPDIAMKLAARVGGLSLSELKSLHVESAQSYAPDHEDLSLDGLSTLSLDVARCLVNAHERISDEQQINIAMIRYSGVPVSDAAVSVHR